MLRFKEIREASAETKAKMKRDLDKGYVSL